MKPNQQYFHIPSGSETPGAANGKFTWVCRLEPGMVVDFFGPMIMEGKRSEVKVYGCLFVCMAARACHLELVDDLSTDLFIMV